MQTDLKHPIQTTIDQIESPSITPWEIGADLTSSANRSVVVAGTLETGAIKRNGSIAQLPLALWHFYAIYLGGQKATPHEHADW